MEKIEAFACGFCSRIYGLKNVAIAHERKCYYNPDTKSCVTCKNFVGKDCCSAGISIENNRLKTRCSDHAVSEDFI